MSRDPALAAGEPTVELPDKLYFRIGEVSRIVGVKPHVLRYWEDELAALKPHRSASGQRLYRRSDFAKLMELKKLLKDEQLTMRGAKRRLRDRGRNQLAIPLPGAAAIPGDRIEAVREGLQKILTLVEDE